MVDVGALGDEKLGAAHVHKQNGVHEWREPHRRRYVWVGAVDEQEVEQVVAEFLGAHDVEEGLLVVQGVVEVLVQTVVVAEPAARQDLLVDGGHSRAVLQQIRPHEASVARHGQVQRAASVCDRSIDREIKAANVLLSHSFTEAPFSIKSTAVATFGTRCSGVWPSFRLWLTLAPFLMRIRMHSRLPLEAAANRAVDPSVF